MSNDTVTQNVASDNGGGLYNRDAATLVNITLSGNTANGPDTGGNIFNDTASLSIKNSIVANSDSDGNCFNSEGFLNSQGHNLDDGDTCGFTNAGDLINADPLLGNLQDNGGGTFTHALLTGSPAIDHGNPADCPKTDQRGYARPADGDENGTFVCDIGAFELDGISPTLTPSPQPVETLTPTLTPAPIVTDTPTPTATSTPGTPSPTPVPQIPPCSSATLVLVALFSLALLRFR